MENKINLKQSFDLNIEKILEDWDVYHAVREIIANAIDEQTLTKTKEIKIDKQYDNTWVIKDFGRGVEYKHLTQKENIEKLSNDNLIGKFGIGLKDALATFNRKKVKVLIKSKYGNIEIEKKSKHDFDDIKTLHAVITAPTDPGLIGTEVILQGVKGNDIEIAKKQFLIFSNAKILDTTSFGQIIEKQQKFGYIYLNGIKIAEEENFLFSYNITSLDSKIKKSLNRERTNVGRAAYSERVKLILKSANNSDVIKIIASDLISINDGKHHDELAWIDIQEHAVKNLSADGNVVFFTSEEATNNPDMVDEARAQGKEIIFISSTLKKKIQNSVDVNGNKIPEFNNFLNEYNDNFEYKIIDPSQLSTEEQNIFKQTDLILKLIGGKPKVVKEILISETIQKDLLSSREELGHWDANTQQIIIKRNQLKNLVSYSGTLIHEIIHAKTNTEDSTREFENELTNIIGSLTGKILN